MHFSLYDATPKDSPRLFMGLIAGVLTATALMFVAVESVPEKKPEAKGEQPADTKTASSTSPAAH
jgi:hypothetical protein